MRRYETIFILRPNVGEDEINRVIDSTTQIILDEKGTVIEIDKWGIKKLAYLINKESLGYYVYCDFAGTPAAVAEIERKFRIDDLVMKYMTIKTKASFSEDQLKAALDEVTEKVNAAQVSEESSEESTEEDAGSTKAEPAKAEPAKEEPAKED